MGNQFRRRCANGDEQVEHTRERHLVIMHRGDSTMIKRRTNRRERREEKRELRSSDSG